MAEERTLVDSVKEFHQQMQQGMVVQANHLCIGSMRDVGVVIGALGVGVTAGWVGSWSMRGGWRYLPIVAGAGLLLAARLVPSERMRFVTRSSMVVGGAALMLSMVHYTLQASLEETRTMEA